MQIIVWIRGSQQMNLADQNVNADGIAKHNNDLSGGVLHAGTGALDAPVNWWGHASGPGGPDGRTNAAGKTIGKGGDIVGCFQPMAAKINRSPLKSIITSFHYLMVIWSYFWPLASDKGFF